jgi:hypothetical protein
MKKGGIVGFSGAGGACCLSAVAGVVAGLRVRSPSVVLLLRPRGLGLSARSSLFVSAMINSCFNNEANMSTQYSLVA